MSGETKQRLSDLEAENALLRESVEYLISKPTLRDQFAMAAMATVGANVAWQRPIDAVEAARCAYDIADAMLKQRG